MMPLQRVCEAESQAGNKLSNGPLRAQSNVKVHRVFCDAAGRRINAGDMLVSCKAHGSYRESRWHRGPCYC
ncbi:MAG TPA: hypothetical protein DD414_10630, partial [Lachnospiraceae bacterium]|nr:hypothetical protein [Lachnospiraceae bacterium]